MTKEEISNNKVAFCSEKAGLSHNMFKLLGFDSEVVAGARDLELHAYNLVYPKGYGKFSAVIYDPSHFVNFLNDNKKISKGYFKKLTEEEYYALKMGEPIKMDFSNTENEYRRLYGERLDNYVFCGDTPYYTFGFEAANKFINSNFELTETISR